MQSKRETNLYQSPTAELASKTEAQNGDLPWFAAVLLVTPLATLVVFAVALFLLVSVGLYDRIPNSWGSTAYRATEIVALGALIVGMTASIIYVLLGMSRFRMLAVVTGVLNGGVLMWGLFH